MPTLGKAQNTRRNLRLFSTLGFGDSRKVAYRM